MQGLQKIKAWFNCQMLLQLKCTQRRGTIAVINDYNSMK